MALLKYIPRSLRVMVTGMLLCYSLPGWPADSASVREQFPEYDIKAAYLVNFAKYVEWPAEAFPEEDSPLRIGVLGSNPFGDILRELAAKVTLGTRTIAVEQADDPKSLVDCHIVFVARVDEETSPPDLTPFAEHPVLLVGEREGFAKRDGTVNFVKVKENVRFEVNLQRARERELKFSSRLLKLALKVYQ
jgi:hypothetical protein